MDSASGPGFGSSDETGTAVDPLIGYRTDSLAFEALLGAGAMGAVYRGRQLRLDRVVAIKVIATHLAANPAYVERFNREAKTLARLHNQHIVTCHDFGPLLGPDGKQLLIMVMEFVDGRSIGELANEPMLVRAALDLYRQSAEGLVAAHAVGVVHRDIKPDNIMVTRSGTAKLADFGLAKADDSIGLTMTGMALGTPAYMAPEVCRGKEPTRASDIYSLGCALFHTVAGEPLYRSASSLETIQCHVSAPTPLLAERVPHLGILDALLAKALVKDQAKRIDAAAFARELAALAASLPENLMTIAAGDARREQIAEMATMATDAVDGDGKPLEPPATATGSTMLPRTAAATGSSVLGVARLDENASDAGIPDAQQARSLKSFEDSSAPASGHAAKDASPRVAARSDGASDAPKVRDIDLGLDGPARPPAAAIPAATPATPAGDGAKKPFAIPDYLQVQPELPPAPPAAAGPVTFGAAAAEPPPAPTKTASSAKLPTGNSTTSASAKSSENAPDTQGGALGSDSARARSAAAKPADAADAKDGKDANVSKPGKTSSSDHVHNAAGNLRVAEAKGHEAEGDVHAAGGRWREAIVAYELGAKAVPSEVARRQLLAKAVAVRAAHGRKLGMIAAVACVVVAAGAIGGWSMLSRHAPDETAAGPVAGATITHTPVPAASGHAGIAELERMAKDQSVDWLAVRAEAKRLLPSAGADAERVQAVLKQASAEADPIDAELAAILAIAKNDPAEALARAERFRSATKRIGGLAARLPLPGRLAVHGPDATAVTLDVDGATMPASGGLLFCRRANGLTRLTVSADGFRKASLTVPPDATPGERVYTLTMTDAPSWTVPVDLGEWAQVGTHGDSFIVIAAHAVLLGNPADGATLAKLEGSALPEAPKPGSSWLPSRDMDSDTLWLASDDGLGVAVHATPRAFGAARVVHRGAPPALAFGERELLFHVGKRACFAVEKTENAFALTARSDDQQMWSFALTGKLDPWLMVEDEAVTVIDDGSLCMLDQEGQLLQSLPLAAIRIGAVSVIAGGACLVVPTSSGTRVLHKVKGRYQELPAASLSDKQLLLASQGSSLLVATGGALELTKWNGNGFAPAWSAALAKGRGATDVSINGAWVACCDDASMVSVFDLATGKLLRSLQLPEAPIAAPLVLSGMVVVADGKSLSGYALVREK